LFNNNKKNRGLSGGSKFKEPLINSFDVTPAEAGVQQYLEFEALDSGSHRWFARNDDTSEVP